MVDAVTRRTVLVVVLAAVGAVWSFDSVESATLEVGPGKHFHRIEDANAKAADGDVILVHPRRDGRAYEKTAVFVRRAGLAFRAVPAEGEKWVAISGEGFDYSGKGSVPRAIFQFNRGTDGCILDGFELSGAHNDSHNGAGVRVNQANFVTVRNCHIHANDMGIMSNGDGTAARGLGLRIENCIIHHNGSSEDPGYNHNLYLGGTSVTLSACEVHSSLTGHNVKSRAHHTRVEYSCIHDSANREFDLVDNTDTERSDSHAVLIGNVIVKDPKCRGNKGLIHFGQDGGREHDGTLYLVHNTIVTPFISPLVELSAKRAKARMVGNLVSDGGIKQGGQQVARARNGAAMENVSGTHNWFSGGFSMPSGTRMDPPSNVFRRFAGKMFVDAAAHDYRVSREAAGLMGERPSVEEIGVPVTPGRRAAGRETPLAWEYRHPAGKTERQAEERPTLGAYARSLGGR